MSGPAGAGKSIAAAQWCRERSPVPVAWTTIEEADADRFVERLLEALQSITRTSTTVDDEHADEHDGERWLDLDVVDRFAAAVAAAPECVIVVDQARAIPPTSAIADVVAALAAVPECAIRVLHIGRLPLQPALAPMLLHGTVAQVDFADLALDSDEIASVVQMHAGSSVEPGTAIELNEWLGGWMAGAVFVGKARPPRNSSTDVMIAAAWPAIHSYVTSEMLGPVPEPLRSFLTDTACVGEISAPLGELLTGRSDSHQLLQSVRESGLPFVHGSSGFESLRLLGVVRAALEEPAINHDPEGRLKRLRQAIVWYGEHDMPVEVAECSFRAGDWHGVADTAVRHFRSILDGQQFRRVTALTSRMPSRVLASDGDQVLTLATLLLWDGRIAAMYDVLAAFQSTLAPESRAMVDLLRAGAASWVDDPSMALAAAESAVESFARPGSGGPGPNGEWVGMAELARASALLAGAYGGEWERARPHFVEFAEILHTLLPQIHHLRVRGARATFLALSGEADSAVREARTAELIASDLGHESHRMAADAYWGLGEALRLRASFDEVDAFVDQVLDLAGRNGRRNLAAAALATRAHLLVDTGRAEETVELIAEHRPRDYGLPHTIEGMIAAAEARAVCAIGAPHRARDLLRAAPVTSMTAAATVTASLGLGDIAGARRALDDWPADRTVASEVRRNLAAASLHDTTGGARGAQTCLRAALTRAADHGLVQPFLEVGTTVRRLLGRIELREKDAALTSLVRVIRGHLDVTQAGAPRFTSREAVVMMYLERGLSLPAIAKDMFVSVNTIKFHVKAIYRKLGVSSRAEAIAAWRAASGATPDV